MESDEKFHIPQLNSSNFGVWVIKMKSVLRAKGLYQLVLGNDVPERDDKGKFIRADALRLDKAHALLITHIHSELVARVVTDGAEDCPVKLWSNINDFGASDKEANIFRGWLKLKHLELRSDGVDDFILRFYDCVSHLRSLGVTMDERSLGHDVLLKIPNDMRHVRDSIVVSGTSSATKITYKTVLDILDNHSKSSNALTIKTEDTRLEENLDSATALITQARCPPGKHLESASHSAKNCFSLHPELLQKYREHLASKNKAEVNLCTAVEAETNPIHDSCASEFCFRGLDPL